MLEESNHLLEWTVVAWTFICGFFGYQVGKMKWKREGFERGFDRGYDEGWKACEQEHLRRTKGANSP